MKFSNFFWPDSSLEQIRICYDAAELTIWNRSMNHKVTVRCEGFIGMTDLCIWDDQIILQAECRNMPWSDVIRSQDTFLQSLCKAYPHSSQWDERRLEDGVVVLSVLLTNHICFRLYCQRIDVAICGEHADSN